MTPNSAADHYRLQTIESAPPIKIVRLLYEGALRFLERACACDPKDPRSEFVHWLGKAEDVVCELRLSLDPAQAPEVCASLQQLYLFCESEITAAMTRRECEPARHARDVLERLAQAWTGIDLDAPAQA